MKFRFNGKICSVILAMVFIFSTTVLINVMAADTYIVNENLEGTTIDSAPSSLSGTNTYTKTKYEAGTSGNKVLRVERNGTATTISKAVSPSLVSTDILVVEQYIKVENILCNDSNRGFNMNLYDNSNSRTGYILGYQLGKFYYTKNYGFPDTVLIDNVDGSKFYGFRFVTYKNTSGDYVYDIYVDTSGVNGGNNWQLAVSNILLASGANAANKLTAINSVGFCTLRTTPAPTAGTEFMYFDNIKAYKMPYKTNLVPQNVNTGYLKLTLPSAISTSLINTSNITLKDSVGNNISNIFVEPETVTNGTATTCLLYYNNLPINNSYVVNVSETVASNSGVNSFSFLASTINYNINETFMDDLTFPVNAVTVSSGYGIDNNANIKAQYESGTSGNKVLQIKRTTGTNLSFSKTGMTFTDAQEIVIEQYLKMDNFLSTDSKRGFNINTYGSVIGYLLGFEQGKFYYTANGGWPDTILIDNVDAAKYYGFKFVLRKNTSGQYIYDIYTDTSGVNGNKAWVLSKSNLNYAVGTGNVTPITSISAIYYSVRGNTSQTTDGYVYMDNLVLYGANRYANWPISVNENIILKDATNGGGNTITAQNLAGKTSIFPNITLYKNIKSDVDLNLIIALYNGNQLKSVSVKPITLTGSTGSQVFSDKSLEGINVLQGEKVKVFVWGTLQNLVPLYASPLTMTAN